METSSGSNRVKRKETRARPHKPEGAAVTVAAEAAEEEAEEEGTEDEEDDEAAVDEAMDTLEGTRDSAPLLPPV